MKSHAPNISDIRVLKLKEVVARTGLTRPTINRQVRLGRFPRAIQLSEARFGWLENELNDWLAERIQQREAA